MDNGGGLSSWLVFTVETTAGGITETVEYFALNPYGSMTIPESYFGNTVMNGGVEFPDDCETSTTEARWEFTAIRDRDTGGSETYRVRNGMQGICVGTSALPNGHYFYQSQVCVGDKCARPVIEKVQLCVGPDGDIPCAGNLNPLQMGTLPPSVYFGRNSGVDTFDEVVTYLEGKTSPGTPDGDTSCHLNYVDDDGICITGGGTPASTNTTSAQHNPDPPTPTTGPRRLRER